MNIDLALLNQANVLVFGDVMLDKYWLGDCQRISPEAPVPVIRVKAETLKPGGAANVAVNITSLGADAKLFGVCGEDEAGTALQHLIQAQGVVSQLSRAAHQPTITKLRLLAQHQQLLRADFEAFFDPATYKKAINACMHALPSAQALLISDYGKGHVAQMQELIIEARNKGLWIVVDPKSSDFEVYRGAHIITPNLRELEAVVGPCPDESTLVTKGMELLHALDLTALLVTRGSQGMTLLQKDEPPVHQPTRAREVFDVTGAGDTVIATLTTALAANINLVDAMRLANLAAGIVVAKVGTAAVTQEELARLLNPSIPHQEKMVTQERLHDEIVKAKAQGKKIVMTNGCFDILHVGHITYLEQAKALGHILVVAVNDDASVKRLKGDTRPVNTLAARMEVLAGLSSIDWVVPFSEDTPEALIGAVAPDVLVKGGDWQVSQIAGAAGVLARGGEVCIIDTVEGYSTTKLIKHIEALS